MQKKLLVIEDEKDIGEMICHIGQEAGFTTRQTNSANKVHCVTEIYREFQPDIIILDILMPGMDGFEVLHYLKEQNSDARIIIMSGSDYLKSAEHMATALELNIEATLEKPFRIGALRNMLLELKIQLPDKEMEEVDI